MTQDRYPNIPSISRRKALTLMAATGAAGLVIPHMIGRENPHILTLSPPVRLESKWLIPTAYMMAKYGMSLCALAIAEELRDQGIASNTLWPRTMVATAAVQNLLGGDEAMARSRKPEEGLLKESEKSLY